MFNSDNYYDFTEHDDILLNIGHGEKTLDTDIMPGVVPKEFINELNAKMEKNFGYKSEDINYIPIGL